MIRRANKTILLNLYEFIQFTLDQLIELFAYELITLKYQFAQFN